MCSLNLNSIVNEQIENSGNQREAIERKLKGLAFAANRETPGLLDALSTHRKRMPPSLKDIRKQDVGYHRLWYSGSHNNCYYDACYLVVYKRGDRNVEKDDDKGFQDHLIKALAKKDVARVIEDPEEKIMEVLGSVSEMPEWRNSKWFREQENYVPPANEGD